MRTLIDNYRNLTAEHCGSGAMRNLLYHYCGLELAEGVVFALGSGLDGMCFMFDEASPPLMLFGRSITMEQDLADSLGLDYTEIMQPDDELAWEEVKQEVAAGRPTMLSGDIYYLDYRKFKVHFPSHRFVLLGFDDSSERVFVADRTDCETQTCSMAALKLSRNPPVGISTYNLWGKFSSGEVRRSLSEACELALAKTVRRMTGEDKSQLQALAAFPGGNRNRLASGLQGIELLADMMKDWHALDDAADYADYIYNAIIKFGTGGGLFRNLFAEFIEWAHDLRSDLVDEQAVALSKQTARQWNALADDMLILREDPKAAELWGRASESVYAIHGTETVLFETLGRPLVTQQG